MFIRQRDISQAIRDKARLEKEVFDLKSEIANLEWELDATRYQLQAASKFVAENTPETVRRARDRVRPEGNIMLFVGVEQ